MQNICLDFTSDKQKIHFYGDYFEYVLKENVLIQLTRENIKFWKTELKKIKKITTKKELRPIRWSDARSGYCQANDF